ncbi:MAG TPA: AAA family ATPase [Gaiellaceae bacterium]|nr:AAA family ATPase [Gaiellaceae bacterium]
MPVCPACQQENPAAARFCFACGTPLAPDGAAAEPREERRIVSVIFVDLVGFTGRAERLDPEDVRALLTPYHLAVRAEIESFGGVVEKFIGDAVMGVFGAPTTFGDDAERAVRAALAVRDRLAAGPDDLQLRIAVNTGEALVALDARPALGEAMVAGDVVNTAARLQAAAAPNAVVVGEETWRATRDVVEYRPGTPVDAKGKAEAVPNWIAVREAAPQGERRFSSTFVGRTRELAALEDVWLRAAEQRTPHLVTVVAAAGVGKTRLAVEFARLVEERGGLTVRGRSLPYRDSSAYGALASQLKQLCGIFENHTPEVAAARLRATVETLLGGPEADDVARHLAILLGIDADATVADRETLFFSIRCFVEAVARDRPTLLVFEDLHWADAALLDLVEMLGARLRDLPILVLVLARPDLLDARPTWGGGLPAYSTLPLGPLPLEEAQQLAAERLAAAADQAVLERAADVVQTAAGNPLFIEQLSARLFETAGADEGPLPTTIRALVAARLDALPPAERSVLLDAAVGGKVFWRGALERMGGHDDLSELLAALERRDLVRRDTVSAIEGEQQFSFTHVLIRDVAYDLLTRRQRREGHRSYALFLESAGAEHGEAGAALARHWREAGETANALRYLVAAAEQADQGWAKDRAVVLYREALELAADDERRRQLRRRLALAEQAVFHLADAQALRRG